MSFSFNGFFGAVPGLSKEARLSVTGAGSTTVNKWVSLVCTVGHECNIAEGHNDGKRSGCRNPIRQEDLKYYIFKRTNSFKLLSNTFISLFDAPKMHSYPKISKILLSIRVRT